MTSTVAEITVGQALATINASIAQFTYEGVVPSEAVEQITYAIGEEIQLRDYLLGLPAEGYTVEECEGFLNYCLSLCDSDKAHPLLTILSAYSFELGSGKHMDLLKKALELDPEYNLAKLLVRVYGAGWSVESWGEMRSTLHNQVKEKISEMLDDTVGA